MAREAQPSSRADLRKKPRRLLTSTLTLTNHGYDATEKSPDAEL